jgi:hypothetical protein
VIPTDTPQTAGWWLRRLTAKLMAEHDHYCRLERYFNSENVVPVTSPKAVRYAYARLMEMSRMNWAELVVEAVRERMQPLGFRTGADSDELGDAAAWRVWQANSMDADSGLLFRIMLSLGCAYLIVGGVDDDTGEPVMTIEDPRCVAVENDAVYRRKAIAGLKLYFDDLEGRWHAYLYLPGVVAQALGPPTDNHTWNGATDFRDWNWFGPPVELPATARNLVPVVQFANQPNLQGRYWSEFEKHCGLLDRVGYQILQRLEIATLQAFKQRAVKGIPLKDGDGNDIDYNDIFSADPGAVWALPATAEMWESGAVDLSPIRLAVRDDVQDLAAATRTPLFYLTPEATNGSAEGATLAREGLVFKATDRCTQAGESLEQAMSYAFLIKGDQRRAARPDMEVVWADPQRHSIAEKYDAATKAVAAGVPWRQRMVLLEYMPQQIDRMESERAADAILATAFPAAPPAQGPPATPAQTPPGQTAAPVTRGA